MTTGEEQAVELDVEALIEEEEKLWKEIDELKSTNINGSASRRVSHPSVSATTGKHKISGSCVECGSVSTDLQIFNCFRLSVCYHCAVSAALLKLW